MKPAIILSLLLIVCSQIQAQDVKKQVVEAARNNPAASQEAGKADALQQKQLRQQNISNDSTAATKPAAITPKKSKKHCGKPKNQ